MLTIIVTVFTDFCPKPEARYNIGWGYIILNVINILYRFSALISSIFRRGRLYLIKYNRKFRFLEKCKVPCLSKSRKKKNKKKADTEVIKVDDTFSIGLELDILKIQDSDRQESNHVNDFDFLFD
jgi:hypothetical protein